MSEEISVVRALDCGPRFPTEEVRHVPSRLLRWLGRVRQPTALAEFDDRPECNLGVSRDAAKAECYC